MPIIMAVFIYVFMGVSIDVFMQGLLNLKGFRRPWFMGVSMYVFMGVSMYVFMGVFRASLRRVYY